MRYRDPILAVLLLGASVFADFSISGIYKTLLIGGDTLPITMNEWLARGFSARKASADKVWIDILQHCGDNLYRLDRGNRLIQLVENATNLDPGFIYLYQFSGAMLMWNCNRPAEAVNLLKKGIRNNPGEQRLKLYLAAFTYFRLNDLGAQVRSMEDIIGLPDTPPMLYRILANIYLKQGRLNQAAKMWVFISEHSDDQADRVWARGKLARHGIRIVR